ncbi:hypothetical protein ECBCE006MS23_5099 [Escherichia coli BCE006_MS-23]|nr:hypothetical protein ECBCE006MS23_5099 [Escherichia coli BCE006_MS-23]
MPLNGFQGQPNRPEQAAGVFAVLCELRPEPADEIAEVLLNNTIMPTGLCRTVGRIRRSRRIRQLAHNA